MPGKSQPLLPPRDVVSDNISIMIKPDTISARDDVVVSRPML